MPIRPLCVLTFIGLCLAFGEARGQNRPGLIRSQLIKVKGLAARITPQPVKRTARAVAKTTAKAAAKTAEKIRTLKKRVQKSRVGRGWQKGHFLFQAKVTRIADRIQAKLSPKMSRAFERLRLCSPLSLGSFAVHKFKKDRAFLATWGAVSLWAVNLQLPALLALGVDQNIAVTWRILTGTPLDIVILALREHHLRKREDPTITFGASLRQLRDDFVRFIHAKQRTNRRWLRMRQAKKSAAAAKVNDSSAGGNITGNETDRMPHRLLGYPASVHGSPAFVGVWNHQTHH